MVKAACLNFLRQGKRVFGTLDIGHLLAFSISLQVVDGSQMIEMFNARFRQQG